MIDKMDVKDRTDRAGKAQEKGKHQRNKGDRGYDKRG
jgi:hypothetical protein